MKFKSLICILILSAMPAHGFDKVLCDSTLDDWSVHNGTGKKNLILNKLQNSAFMSKKQSQMLIVKDRKNRQIASVLPWDGITLLQSKTAKKENYKFTYQSDNYSWFTLQIESPATKAKHNLNCRLTF
ncbi:hypothetical protein [Bdellovibrio sp. NC01]|uniref:hypothetical protein n=1 Tax=Bdellovibrio sp. NC01 TaxID=2220073 RepID=UPI001157BF45|nr:hypothetical protein [Bdellovibrio sp. NC01]QDK36293.1 hypothetical protein DOE51_01105 [Bdellovibrio sp. NC01]